MKILVTGSRGFVGRNLCAELRNRGYTEIVEYDKDSGLEVLHSACKDADFVFHLAGINRPLEPEEFITGNLGFTTALLDMLRVFDNNPPILLSSSIQAELDNPYGISKKAGEDVLFTYSQTNDAKVYIFRLANLFGKWSRPNYNSVTATFCHNVAHGKPLQINDPGYSLGLVYIDDVVSAFIDCMEGRAAQHAIGDYYSAGPITDITLGDLAATITSFKDSRESLLLADFDDYLTKCLYSTYLSYLPEDKFSYPLVMHKDQRGSFTEFIKTLGSGQVSINVSKPGIVKGNHWHHTKNEKFLVVSGEAEIRFRQIFSEEVITYKVSSENLEVVDIPVGYTHDIINTGQSDLVTVMWANEVFDSANPDTFPLNVEISEESN